MFKITQNVNECIAYGVQLSTLDNLLAVMQAVFLIIANSYLFLSLTPFLQQYSLKIERHFSKSSRAIEKMSLDNFLTKIEQKTSTE